MSASHAVRLAALLALPFVGDPPATAQERTAIRCSKLLTCAAEESAPQVIDSALVLVEDGRITHVGDAGPVPEGYTLRDFGESWVAPGFIDLHSHVGGSRDWGSQFFLNNPGTRVACSVIPDNRLLRRAVAGGVTTVLYIPGSATNMSGHGVLLKTGFDEYEDMRIRDPGSLKIAQAGNPERWAYGVGRSFMNWQLRHTIRRGLVYAQAWKRFEESGGDAPRIDPQWEIFRALADKRTQISIHTQMYQVVLMSVLMLRRDFELDVYIDHGTFDGYRAGGIAQEHDVPAILGPRQLAYTMLFPSFAEFETDGRVYGVAASYQQRGHRAIGFNTDAIQSTSPGNVTTEELPLQAAMGVRYGMSNERLQSVRGVTIVPARAAGIAERVGSVEVGKDADLVVLDGDPTDPRTSVRAVFIEGRCVYDADNEPRRW